MLPLKAASFPHFASRWGCLKRAGRVLKVLINRGTSNMFGKDLHFHTGTLNYCNPSSSPPPSSLLLFPNCWPQAPLPFSPLWHFEEFVVAVYWPPLYDNGGEKTLHLQKKRQEPILISVWTNANVKWKEEKEDGREGKAIEWHLFPDGDGWWRRGGVPVTLVPSGVTPPRLLMYKFDCTSEMLRNHAGEDVRGGDRCWQVEWCSFRADSWAQSCDPTAELLVARP